MIQIAILAEQKYENGEDIIYEIEKGKKPQIVKPSIALRVRSANDDTTDAEQVKYANANMAYVRRT